VAATAARAAIAVGREAAVPEAVDLAAGVVAADRAVAGEEVADPAACSATPPATSATT